jgi:uncharacterized protein (TIGR02117 family)
LFFVIRTFFRYFFRTLTGIIAFLLIWLIAAFSFPYIVSGYGPLKQDKSITVFVESNGVHTDFVLPVKTEYYDWSGVFPYSDFEIAGPAFEYISVGWGDKGFFIGTPTWADLKFSTAFNAAFGLSSTAMHITYKRHQPREGNHCKKIRISQFQYKILRNYVLASFRKENGRLIHIDHPGYSDYDCFYEATGTYTLFNTCNVWTGNGLRAAGISAGAWTPLCGGVMQNLDH